MPNMKEREDYLMSVVNSTGQITTLEAVELLGVSAATVRRLFSKLESEGKVTRDYGGVRASGDSITNTSFELREQCNQGEKRLIGQMAAALVEDGDTIYLDSGTTIFQMVLSLGERIAKGDFNSLNIVTNSIVNAQALPSTSSCCIVLTGGRYHHDQRDFSGTMTEKFVSPLYFTKCFLSCDGMKASGFSLNNIEITGLNNVVMKHSDKVFILADSSKWGRFAMMVYTDFEQIDQLITDRQPDVEYLKCLKEAGVKLVLPMDPAR